MPKKPPESPVVGILRGFRRAFESLEERVVDTLAEGWARLERGLAVPIHQAAQELLALQASGKVLTESQLWRQGALLNLLGQLERSTGVYNATTAIEALTLAQRDAIALGSGAARTAIEAQNVLAYARLRAGALEQMIGFAADGSPLTKLLAADYGDAAGGILQALTKGLGQGLGPDQLAAKMMTGTDLGLDRAVLIARTESARAYRTATLAQYRESGVVQGYRRLANAGTACIACLFLDGKYYALEEDFGDHPRGNCTLVPWIVDRPAPQWQTGTEAFQEKSAGEQRAILGPERFNLWQSGSVKLKDFATLEHDPVWGEQPQVTPLRELRQWAQDVF